MDRLRDFLVDYPWIGLPLIGVGWLVILVDLDGLGLLIQLVGGLIVVLHQYAAGWLIKQQRSGRPKA